jgi:hypothetical protein
LAGDGRHGSIIPRLGRVRSRNDMVRLIEIRARRLESKAAAKRAVARDWERLHILCGSLRTGRRRVQAESSVSCGRRLCCFLNAPASTKLSPWKASTVSYYSGKAGKALALRECLLDDLSTARALYNTHVKDNPDRLVMLCDRARVLARSDRR